MKKVWCPLGMSELFSSRNTVIGKKLWCPLRDVRAFFSFIARFLKRQQTPDLNPADHNQ